MLLRELFAGSCCSEHARTFKVIFCRMPLQLFLVECGSREQGLPISGIGSQNRTKVIDCLGRPVQPSSVDIAPEQIGLFLVWNPSVRSFRGQALL